MRGLTSNDTGRNDSVMLITAKMIKIIFMFIKSENFFGCARKYFLRICVGFRAFFKILSWNLTCMVFKTSVKSQIRIRVKFTRSAHVTHFLSSAVLFLFVWQVAPKITSWSAQTQAEFRFSNITQKKVRLTEFTVKLSENQDAGELSPGSFWPMTLKEELLW